MFIRRRNNLRVRVPIDICPYCENTGAAEADDGRLVPCPCGQPPARVAWGVPTSGSGVGRGDATQGEGARTKGGTRSP
jgi:hypothetical protein